MKRKCYISGQITGNPNYIQDFECAERQLKAWGFKVVNPLKVSRFDADKTWADYMRDDIKALCGCDTIYMLKNWTCSRGARLERKVAEALGLNILHEGNYYV